MRGGKRSGAGRKPGSAKPQQRGTVKQVRWTAEEWGRVEEAAIAAGLTPSEYIRKTVLTGREDYYTGYERGYHDGDQGTYDPDARD